MRIKSLRSNQSGDTIVEVLLTILIVASVMGGAFLVTNSSSKDVRNSQEHTEALQLLQGQMELFRSAAKNAQAVNEVTRGTSDDNADPFCMSGTALDGDGECTFGEEGRYKIEMKAIPQGQPNLVKVTGVVTWQRLDGGMGNETLVYHASIL